MIFKTDLIALSPNAPNEWIFISYLELLKREETAVAEFQENLFLLNKTKRQLEATEQRATLLAQKLKALGINPDEV